MQFLCIPHQPILCVHFIWLERGKFYIFFKELLINAALWASHRATSLEVAPRSSINPTSRIWCITRQYRYQKTVKMKLALFALFAGSAAAFAPAQTGVRFFSGTSSAVLVWLKER